MILCTRKYPKINLKKIMKDMNFHSKVFWASKETKNMIRVFQLHTPMSHEATEMELFLRKLKKWYVDISFILRCVMMRRRWRWSLGLWRCFIGTLRLAINLHQLRYPVWCYSGFPLTNYVMEPWGEKSCSLRCHAIGYLNSPMSNNWLAGWSFIYINMRIRIRWGVGLTS